jgi:CHASE2 domain-containing sensor protein
LVQQGFNVTLAIGAVGKSPEVETTGYLPPAPELTTHLQSHWQNNYRRLGAPYRIQPKGITYGGSIKPRIDECKRSANLLRDRFRQWLDSEAFRPLNMRLREELNRGDAVRVLVRTDDPDLQKLPWQEWDFFESYAKAEVALGAIAFDTPKTIASLQQSTRFRILAILGHSKGLDVEADRRLLQHLPKAETTFLVEPNHQQLNDRLWEQSWDIIFFAGHSETEGERGRIYINKTDSLTIDELRYALKKAVDRGLKLAIFNSCDGLGLARQLHDLQIPHTIVMRELVPDQIAQEFLKHFLTAFAAGQSFYLAAREARERLQGWEKQFPCASWLPIIYQNLQQEPLTWPQSKPRCHSWRKVLLASLAVTGLVMGGRGLGLLQPLELKAFDKLVELRPAEQPDPRSLVVEVTAEDIANLGGEYPLHDKTLLRLLKKLEAHQPRAIGLDIYRDKPEDEGHEEFVQHLQQSDRVVPVCVVPSAQIPEGIASLPGIPDKQLGFADVVLDPDGVPRRHLIAMQPPAASPCSTYYALSFQLARRYLEAEGVSLQFDSEDRWQLGSVTLNNLAARPGFYQNDVELQGFQIPLNYRVTHSPENLAEQVTLSQVLDGQLAPKYIRDKMIFIGVTDPVIKDDFKTPNGEEIRGLLLHAHMASQIVNAVKEQRPLLWFLPPLGDVFWVWIWSLTGGGLVWYFRSLVRLVVGLGVALVILGGSCCLVLLATGGVLPLVPSVLALLVTSSSLMLCATAFRAVEFARSFRNRHFFG